MSKDTTPEPEHEHHHEWTGWYVAGQGVTHDLEANDYKCACGDLKGRDTRNGRAYPKDDNKK